MRKPRLGPTNDQGHTPIGTLALMFSAFRWYSFALALSLLSIPHILCPRTQARASKVTAENSFMGAPAELLRALLLSSAQSTNITRPAARRRSRAGRALGRKNNRTVLPARLRRRGANLSPLYMALNEGKDVPAVTLPDEKWTYDGAYRYWLQQSAYPKKELDWGAYARAFSQRSRMSTVGFKEEFLLPTQQPRWDFLGPNNLPVPMRQYYGEGTVSGRINGVAFDPKNPSVMYLASAGGGFWRYKGEEDNWTCLSDDWENVKFSSVAVNPTDSKIIIVGTGDYDGALGYGFGLMMTKDGGQSWQNILRKELRWYSVSQILFDPDHPDIITVTAGRHPHEKGKMLRSEDGGATWANVNVAPGEQLDWTDVQVSQKGADGRRYYYATSVRAGNDVDLTGFRHDAAWCDAAGVWRSEDRGRHWIRLAVKVAGDCVANVDVAPSPSAPRRVYLITSNNFRGEKNPVPGHVWLSDKAGDGWRDITGNFPHHEDISKQDAYNWSQSWYDFYIRCSKNPTTGQDVIYVGLIDLVASVDGGGSWQSVGRTYQLDAKTHNDQHAFVVNPNDPNDLLIGNDGGVYHLIFDPKQRLWTFQNNLNARLGMTMFYRIAVDPNNPDWVLGGAQDNATPVSMGDLSRWSNKGDGDGGFCAINPQTPKIQYATSQDLHIFRTDDGWSSYQPISPLVTVNVNGVNKDIDFGPEPRGFIAPIALDPKNPNKLYAGTNFLWRWEEGTGWGTGHISDRALASSVGDISGYISFIAIAPTDSSRIYTGSSLGDLFMSTDAGSTWQRIDNDNTIASSPALPVTSIAVNPNNPDSILVGFGSTEAFAHIWRCDNTRADEIQWTPVGGVGARALPFIPLNAIAVDPRRPDSTYYVATDVGVFLSKDGGNTWANFGAPLGLPNVRVTDLQIVPGTRRLVAATFGRGVWRIDLPEEADSLFLRLSGISPASSTHIRRVKRRR